MSVFVTSLSRRCRLVAATLLVCAAGVAQAQSSADRAGDPPDRVARLSYVVGNVDLLPAGAQSWSEAGINRPLTRGDKLSTGTGARAELELDGGTLRIDRQTRFGFLELGNHLAQAELTRGTLNLAVRQLDAEQSYEIDTPTVALVVEQPGTFRVDVDSDGQTTRVTVIDGSATVYGENGAQRTVSAGRSYRFDDSSLATVALDDLDGEDAFDRWCADRDQRYARSRSRRYVSDDMVGYQDLDRYGDWQSNADYGQVWYPNQVSSDWAPYRDGHWAYIAPWGWSWVDDSPWGFAPYHYGRWAYVGSRWGWVPGPVAIRPIYAPALVAFVGGSGWNVSIGVGGGAPVGWFPLAPGEVYNPWYRSSRRYYTQVNVTNIYVHDSNRTVIINRINNQYNDYGRYAPPVRAAHYANRDAPRGFTAVPGRSFVGSRQVQRDLLQLDPKQLARAPVLGRAGTPPPTRASLAPHGDTPMREMPERAFQREVVARHAPPPAFVAPVALPSTRSGGAASPAARYASSVRLLQTGRQAEIATGEPSSTRPREAPERDPRGASTRDGVDSARTVLPSAARLRAGDATSPPALRAGELRSARFARPSRDGAEQADVDRADFGRDSVDGRENTQANQRGSMRDGAPPRALDGSTRTVTAPRPAVSYGSGANGNQARELEPNAARPASGLPQVRRFEPGVQQMMHAPIRSDRREAPRVSDDGGASEPSRFDAMRLQRAQDNHLRAPEFNVPPQRAEPYERRAPSPYQPPRGNGPPRPLPQTQPAALPNQMRQAQPRATDREVPARERRDPPRIRGAMEH